MEAPSTRFNDIRNFLPTASKPIGLTIGNRHRGALTSTYPLIPSPPFIRLVPAVRSVHVLLLACLLRDGATEAGLVSKRAPEIHGESMFISAGGMLYISGESWES
jgi:hypothetical protein